MISTLFQQPYLFVIWVIAILVALATHEFAHAAVSALLGDHTAKRLGRLTLNPVAHVDPLGFASLVLVGFGWGKPVPFNPYNLRNQKWGPVAIALAGPGMNILLALTFGLVFRLVAPALGEANLLVQFLLLSITLNLALFFFNLIPIPPLDGSKLLLAFLSGKSAERTRIWLETRGPIFLLGLVVMDSIFGLGLFGWLSRLIMMGTSYIVGA